MVWLRSFYY